MHINWSIGTSRLANYSLSSFAAIYTLNYHQIGFTQEIGKIEKKFVIILEKSLEKTVKKNLTVQAMYYSFPATHETKTTSN